MQLCTFARDRAFTRSGFRFMITTTIRIKLVLINVRGEAGACD